MVSIVPQSCCCDSVPRGSEMQSQYKEKQDAKGKLESDMSQNYIVFMVSICRPEK